MAQYQITVDGNAIQGLLTRDDGLARLVELVVNRILEAKLTEQLKAAPYERTEERQGYCNGHRDKTITTRIGKLVFSVPRRKASAERAGVSVGHDGDGGERCFNQEGKFIKVRKGGWVRMQSVMIATGINRDGYRKVLGLKVGDSELEESWSDFFGWLKGRGLRGVDLVVSDDHKGLVKDVTTHFQGATWQRCQTYFMRNILESRPSLCSENSTDA